MATHAPITDAQTRAPFFPVPLSNSDDHHLHLTATLPRVASRRDLLCFAGAATALGAAVTAGATVLASEAIPAPAVAPTPFAVAHADYRAAQHRIDNLRGLTPQEWETETAVFLATVEAVDTAPASNLHEFALSFIVACDDGNGIPLEKTLDRLLADAKRLTGVA